jgi:hypothetical protein
MLSNDGIQAQFIDKTQVLISHGISYFYEKKQAIFQ